MARRRRQEAEDNHEAWAIPYGDLITLLLGFFVVMYAVSSVNEGRYRVLSESLVAAFRGAPRSLEPIQVGTPSHASRQDHGMEHRPSVELDAFLPDFFNGEGRREMPVELLRAMGWDEIDIEEAETLVEDIAGRLSVELAEQIEQDLIRIEQDRFWFEIQVNTSLLFSTASADLAVEARPLLRRIAAALSDSRTRINVEGHTDSRPIRTVAFPSNWELSAARASTVVHLFMEAGIAPERMAVVGFGQHRPVADNDSAAGRRQNRRVVLVVMAGSRPRTEVPFGAIRERTRDGEGGPAAGVGETGEG